MSSEAIIGAVAALTALVTAVFAGLVSLRQTRRYVATADVLELRAYREAWLWAVRVIYRLLRMISATDGIQEPPEIRSELRSHQDAIDNPVDHAKREMA